MIVAFLQDRTSCECKPVVATCSATGLDGVGGQSAVGISGVRDSEREAAAAVGATAKYVGLGCVVMVALAMILRSAKKIRTVFFNKPFSQFASVWLKRWLSKLFSIIS